MPMEDGFTVVFVFDSPPAAAPLLLLLSVVVCAELAELIGLPSPMVAPASRGIEGSSIAINVLTVGLSLLYRGELEFNSASDNGFTWSLGTYAIANVVIYPFFAKVL